MAVILVIEDNPVNLELTSYLLQAHGHRVLLADDGARGLAMARAERPDLVICDLQMPGMDGLAVAAEMRADPALQGLPLLAVTASAMVGDRDRALRAGFDAHMAKPIDPQAFVPWLASFLPSRASGPPATETVPGPLGEPLATSLRAPWPGLVLLMVDDRPVHQELKRDLLEPAGYSVVCCADGESAWHRLGQGAIDAVVSDVVMPGVDGWALLQLVRAEWALANLPFIFLTSTARDSVSRARALAMGADSYLIRPIEPDALLLELRSVLETAGRR